jgi:hypothetical protein
LTEPETGSCLCSVKTCSVCCNSCRFPWNRYIIYFACFRVKEVSHQLHWKQDLFANARSQVNRLKFYSTL